jgi:hypothetical protein
MKKFYQVLLLLLVVATVASVTNAAPFTAGNLVVYRVGDGSAALSSAATAVFLDEYTPSGTLVQSIALPTTASGSNNILTASGAATSEGLLTLSVDRQFLFLAGYNAATGTASVSGTNAATVQRVVGRVNSAGTIDTTTALTDFSSTNNPRGAVSTNGTDIWVSGGAGGVRYATLGSTTSTQLSTTVTNVRSVNIFGGQLYVSTSSGLTVRLGTVGTGTPTTSGQTITNLPSFPTSGSPYQYYFADLDGAPGLDTVYVADDTNATSAIQKYSLVGGNWTLNGNITVGSGGSGCRGLTGRSNAQLNSTVVLYATCYPTTSTNGAIYSVIDTSGFNQPPIAPPAPDSPAATVTQLTTAGANTAFRGIAFAPNTVTAASATVSGRVINYNGRGIGKVFVTMTDSNGRTIYVVSNPFGYFTFPEIAVGQTYVFAAYSKKYNFVTPAQVLTVIDNYDGLLFTAMPDVNADRRDAARR